MPSISIAKGRGSLNHNKRIFKTENVDAERSVLNRVLVDLELQSVYHELFDEAVKRYNSKQKRADRKIKNYLQHVRSDKKTKEFHELVVQIGNKDDVQNLDPNVLADMLQEYLVEFIKRNSQMKVFYAIIHMDQTTPHLHLDYVPFATNQTRGLETRISNDRAIKQMGYASWLDWRTSEMDKLADILHRNGFERTIMNDDTIHLSVAAYKKLQREVDKRTAYLTDINKRLECELEEMKECLSRRDYCVKNLLFILQEQYSISLNELIIILNKNNKAISNMIYDILENKEI